MGAAPCVKVPCFTCCDEGSRHADRQTAQGLRTLRTPGFDVELAVSPLAGLKGAAGYHTSVVIAGEEYFFSPGGIIHTPGITSHKGNPEMKLVHIGLSRYSGADLMELLDQFFPPGHYDLLRKNCNSFSDCALYFLCKQRLDWNYRSLERLGQLADDHAGVIQSISGGEYLPNPRAVNFDLQTVIREIEAAQEACEGNNEMIESLDDGAFMKSGPAREELFMTGPTNVEPTLQIEDKENSLGPWNPNSPLSGQKPGPNIEYHSWDKAAHFDQFSPRRSARRSGQRRSGDEAIALTAARAY